MEQELMQDGHTNLKSEKAQLAAEAEKEELLLCIRQLREDMAVQVRCAKKQLFMSRLCTLFLAVLLGALLFAGTVLVPRVNTLLTQANEVLASLHTTTDTLAQIDFKGTIDNVNSLVTTSEQDVTAALTEVQTALQKLQSIDIDTLNQAISDLAGVVSPLSRLFK